MFKHLCLALGLLMLLAGCDRVVFVAPDGACTTATHAGLVADPAYAELVLR